MKIIDDYVAYIKDNPEGYWFKRKLYGYGWVPATKSGWLVVLLYLAFVLSLTLHLSGTVSEEEVTKLILAPIAFATILFLIITIKTGEPPRWQWGRKKDD